MGAACGWRKVPSARIATHITSDIPAKTLNTRRITPIFYQPAGLAMHSNPRFPTADPSSQLPLPKIDPIVAAAA
jgi:hypothetical protein